MYYGVIMNDDDDDDENGECKMYKGTFELFRSSNDQLVELKYTLPPFLPFPDQIIVADALVRCLLTIHSPELVVPALSAGPHVSELPHNEPRPIPCC